MDVVAYKEMIDTVKDPTTNMFLNCIVFASICNKLVSNINKDLKYTQPNESSMLNMIQKCVIYSSTAYDIQLPKDIMGAVHHICPKLEVQFKLCSKIFPLCSKVNGVQKSIINMINSYMDMFDSIPKLFPNAPLDIMISNMITAIDTIIIAHSNINNEKIIYYLNKLNLLYDKTSKKDMMRLSFKALLN